MARNGVSSNGNGLYAGGSNGHNGVFGSPASANDSQMAIDGAPSNYDMYDEFAKLLEKLHFNAYNDIFDVVKEFGRVASTRYVKKEV